jgi:hypothetical protein
MTASDTRDRFWLYDGQAGSYRFVRRIGNEKRACVDLTEVIQKPGYGKVKMRCWADPSSTRKMIPTGAAPVPCTAYCPETVLFEATR